MKNNNFMEMALKQAQMAFDKNEVPVGAVIVKNGQIIAQAHNQNIALRIPDNSFFIKLLEFFFAFLS